MKAKFLGLLALLAAISIAPAFGGAVITNGTGIYLGVNDHGHLNFTDGVTTSLNGTAGFVGVSIDADLSAFGRGSGIFDATSPGCWCEGWGAAGNGVSGWASLDNGFNNVGLVSFVGGGSTATSITTIGGVPLQVTHDFSPSTSSSLMMVHVTLKNMSDAMISDVRYNRTMDWDVPPSEFNEFVEIGGWPATALFRTTNNGFATPDPLFLDGGLGGCPINANFAFCGPQDHGAFFTFAFGDLAAGESIEFDIFYGAAFTRSLALAALGSVDAEVYSLGTWNGGNPDGTPLTYAFGFRGVGGDPIPIVPEPGTYALMATGLGALLYGRRRMMKK
jgi:type IV pilus assembly protein PilY1